jgi:hypothetical protein
MEKIVVQKIVKRFPNVAEKYFSIVSALNDLKLKQRDIQLLGFVALYGNISDGVLRMQFCEKYGVDMDGVNNLVYRLKKMGMLVKEDKTIKLNPVFVFDYGKDVQLQIELRHE